MMEKLRATTNSVALKIIIVLIILSFILTGVSGYLVGGANDYAAKVNGEKISQAKLEQAFQSERARMQQQLGEQFSTLASNESYMSKLRQQTLEQLINNVLLNQYTQKLGLTVSDEQVKESIRQIPYFQTDNKFDNTKYLNLINSMGYKPDQFAQLQRQQLILQQLLQAVGSSEFILPMEMKKTAELVLQQRDVRLATIDVNALQAHQKVTNTELKNYYHQNKKDFIAPAEIKISYILMDMAEIQKKITVSEKEIESYYQQHKNNYIQPERKHFSVIQLKTEKEAQAILAELKTGADFATLAKQKSVDIISRKNGGTLGWLEASMTLDELKQANLTEKGQLSDVIKSSVGYLIVRLNDIKPEQSRAFKEVRTELLKKVQQEKTLDAYYALQQQVSTAAANNNDSLASAEVAADLQAKKTNWFTRRTVPAELNFKPVIQAIFEGSLIGADGASSGNSDVINVEGDKAFVIRVDGYTPEKPQSFDQASSEIRELIKRQKAENAARTQGEKILAALRQEKDIQIMKKEGLNFGKKETLSRSSYDEMLIKTIFALAHPQKNKPVYGLSQDSKGNFVLIELLTVTAGKLSQDEEASFINKMQEASSGMNFEALMANLHQQATIKISATES